MNSDNYSSNLLRQTNIATSPVYGNLYDNESFFKVKDLQDFYVDHFLEKAPLPINSYGILWIQKGSGKLKIDINDFSIEQNMLLYFTPGQVLQLDADENMSGHLISFSGDYLLLSDKMVNNAFTEVSFSDKQSLTFPDLEIIEELEDIIAKMKRENVSGSQFRKQILNGLLRIFILYLSRSNAVVKQDKIPDRDRDMVRKFMILVKSNFLTKKMVIDYAKELCVSPNYLNRLVKKISGFTASHHIQQCIIMEAKRQALYSDLSMKEVAYSLGFNDYAHFSKFFKNNSGTNFSCFKTAIQ